MPRTCWTATVALLLSISVCSLAAAQAQPAASDFPWEGEINGTNVYVRSLAGLNHYPTTKLNTGDRVLVLGEKFGWYKIAPMPNSFSYIDMGMVTRQGAAPTGTVNRDQVFVRAGSRLSARKANTQVVLNQGATVQIIGEADGFYKIKPPAGACLYVSKEFVRQVPHNLTTGMVKRYAAGQTPPTPKAAPRTVAQYPAARPAGNPPAIREAPIASKTEPAAARAVRTVAAPRRDANDVSITQDGPPLQVEPTLSALKTADSEPGANHPKKIDVKTEIAAAPIKKTTGRYEALLAAAEGELGAMMTKPLADRDFDLLIKRYQEIAAQDDEYVPRNYAKIRIDQLETRTRILQAKIKRHADAEELEAFRIRKSKEQMQAIRRRAEAVMEKFDLEGELRKSFAFAPEKRRFRLVDPKGDTTIAYVDIPREVSANVEHLVGRRVGIRVSGQRYSPSARIPIAVAARITDLTPRTLPEALPKTGDSSNPPNTPKDTAQSTLSMDEDSQRVSPKARETVVVTEEKDPAGE